MASASILADRVHRGQSSLGTLFFHGQQCTLMLDLGVDSIGTVRAIDAGKHRLQSVIIRLSNGIEFVVMAARQCTVRLANVDIVVATMSSRSFERAISLSIVPSRNST